MKVKILDITQDPLFNISMAARQCYNSRSKDTVDNRKDFVKGIIKSGHTSMLEMAHVIFDVEGVSRSCLAQVSRHRIGVTLAVQSQRYVNQQDNKFVFPPELEYNKFDDEKNLIFENAIQNARAAYRDLLSLGVKKEDARFVLPEATSTNFTICFNFRSLRHFLELRLSSHAQWEVRKLAQEFKRLIMEKGLGCLVEDIKG